MTGTQTRGETNKVEIDVGYFKPPDSDPPVLSNIDFEDDIVLNCTDETVTVSVEDATGIESVEYSLDGQAWLPMSPADGAFDSTSETATADFTASPITLNEICVRATDTLNDMSEPYCGSFTVTYAFEGFFQPIDGNLRNGMRAGSTAPMRFRIRNGSGGYLGDLGAVVMGQTGSRSVACTGGVEDALEEYATGNTALRYDASAAQFVFNWQSPRLPGTCQRVKLVLADG